VLVGFVTPRLEVRRLTMADLDAFHEIWGDPAVIFWGAAKDRDATRARLQDFMDRRLDGMVDSGWSAVVRRRDGQLVGDVVLQPAPWDRDLAEVGWHFGKAWQGRGYSTEAGAGLLAHAKRHGVASVYAKILPDNVASRGVALRLGMRIVGHLDDPHGLHDLWAKTLHDDPSDGPRVT
jgi:ribosomal-protein-alanine N-acetyltransferase